MDDVELSRYAAEAFRHMDRAPHPSIDQMAEFVSGELTASARIEFESHLEACDSCRRRLEEYEHFVSDSDRPAVKDLSREWTRLRRRIHWHKATATVVRWRTAAAVVTLAAVAGLSWLLAGLLTTSPAQLLARAYQEERPFDIRLAGAKHSDIKRQRGGGSMSNNVAWLKAKARLEEEIRSKPDDLDTLRLMGEAEMMSREAAKAVQTLQKARDLKPDDAGILADLGAAYALRGEIENQYGDYMSAIDYMGQSLHLKPRVAEVVFNLALVLERDAQLKDQAIEQWNLYLELDHSSDWAKEARQHRDSLEKALQSREDALHQTVEDPGQFLTRVAAGEPIDAEAYLRDIVITKWLPLTTSDGPARQATIKLAQILRDRHGDTWLSEMVNSISGPQMQPGLQKLAEARAANRAAQADVAIGAAADAQRDLLSAGSNAAALWARLEGVVGLRNSSRPQESLAAGDQLILDLEPLTTYHWLRSQLRLECASSAMRIGRLKEALIRVREAANESRAGSLAETDLRASIFYLDCVRHIGLPSQFYASAQDCLKTFWSKPYPVFRFWQIVDRLRGTAVRTQQEYATWFCARSAAAAASKAGDPRAEAPAYAYLAAAAQEVAEETEARTYLQLSDQLFPKIPVAYRLEPQILLAEVELRSGSVDDAMRRLELLRDDMANPPSVLSATRYYSILGSANRQKANYSAALDAFHKSIDWGKQRIASLSSEAERTGVLETIEDSYRGLVAATLATSGEPAEALHQWQSFRALDSLGTPGPLPVTDAPVLWFVELPDGLVCWLSRSDQVHLHRFSVSKEAVNGLAARFRHECADPETTMSQVQADARQLYKWMVEPFAAQLAGIETNLILELDGALTGIPVQALMTPGGRYLADDFSMLVSSSYRGTRQMDSPVNSARVLIVANPTLTGDTAARFPPLPNTQAEVDAVRGAFSGSSILQGANATIDQFIASLPAADVVHFVGHGDANSEKGTLLFAPRDTMSECDLLQSADILRQNWSHCKLAVLSACSTAAGEARRAHNPDSLVRAITRAGGGRVAASLWKVDSASTAELMKAFYASLAGGATPSEALVAAERHVREQPSWAHPYYWASFQLYGTT